MRMALVLAEQPQTTAREDALGGWSSGRSRGRHMGNALWAVAAALGATWSSFAAAAPSHVRLSFTGPTDTAITVVWNTPADVGSSVEYGTTPGSYPFSATGSSFLGAGPFGYIHEVAVAGLNPATTYYYRAGNSADGWAGEYSFTTGPALDPDCGRFQFVYLGDNRPQPGLGGGENYDQILGEAFLKGPAFLLNGGDLVADGNDTGQWLDYLGYNDDQVAYLPNMPSLGNHDTGPATGDDAHYNQLFALPRSAGTHGSGTEDYYFFRFGNAIFVSLSTETFMTGATPMADQAAWLDEVLTQNPARWKFLYYHKPTYTHEVWFSISHVPNEEGQNAALTPIIDKHHVDVVLTSHNHWYERYAPSACATQGQPDSSDPCPVGDPADGTVYVVSGGAGAYTIPGWLCGSAIGRETCSGDHHYILFSVDGDTMTMDTWGAYPQSNQLIDTLTIAKPGVSCEPPVPPDAGSGGTSAGGAGSTGGDHAGGALNTGGSGNTPPGAGGSWLGASPGATSEEAGCGCSLVGQPARGNVWPALAGLGALAVAARRRRRTA